MKKLWVLLLAAAVLMGACAEANAIQFFKKTFDDKYAAANPALKAKVAEAKCMVCHAPGVDKKKRNDYGVALSKHLKKEDFTAAKLKAAPDATTKAVIDALDKVAGEKNPAGELYGDRLKAGELPGTVNPP
jgi:hypothetical protein